jgi:hypothetical protein
LFPQKDIFLRFSIKGTTNIIGRFRKNIISTKESSFKECTATAIKVKQIEAKIIIKIPVLGLSSCFSSEISSSILLILIAPPI